MKDKKYLRLLEGNQLWAHTQTFHNPGFFKNLSIAQKPEYLWIGCADSRVNANEITNTQAGEMFIHRNIANMVVSTDVNLLSVLDYAVNILDINHIIVCGHYGCGGIKAAMEQKSFGFVDSWLSKIKDVYNKYYKELEAIPDLIARQERLVELNVIEQVHDLAKTTIVQGAWKKRKLQIHGWVYSLEDGIIKELNTIIDEPGDLEPIFRYNNL
jgi:carbonic anhydrase